MKNSKRNIVISAILSLALCVSLIAGATFAIFTSESKVNIAVTSGKVNVVATIPNESLKLSSLKDIDMNTFEGTEVDRTTEGTFLTGGTATLSDGTLTLDRIMPGDKATFRIIVHNDSNVKVKFRTKVKAENDDGLLAGLKFNIGVADNAMVSAWQEMAVGADDIIYNCYVELPASAGNAYMGKSCKLVFEVEAVQGNAKTTNEVHYPVDSDSLKSSLAEGGTVYINRDFTTDAAKTSTSDRATIANPTTINLNGTITVPGSLEDSNNWAALYISNDTTINATNGGITCLDKESGSYLGGPYVAHIAAPGKTITVNGGTYYAGGTVFNVQAGTLVVNGGFYEVYPDIETNDYRYLLNCIDASYNNGTANIVVKGGTFVNFDPSNNSAEGEGTNFVAEGYTVIAEVKDEKTTWFTVVKGSGKGVVAGSKEEITDAITGNDAVTVKITNDGTYTLPSLEGKDVTIIGTKDTVIDMKGAVNKGTKVSMEGVTVEFANENYKGFQHTGKLVYKNCTVKGLQFLYADDVEFIACEFVQDKNDAYHVWTYGAKNVTFTDCDFTSTDKSKAVLCYTDGIDGATFTRTFNNCRFTATGTAEKSAIMINPSANALVNTYIININNCIATGYAENGIAGQTIVGVKETVKDNITVNITDENGTRTVYTH